MEPYRQPFYQWVSHKITTSVVIEVTIRLQPPGCEVMLGWGEVAQERVEEGWGKNKCGRALNANSPRRSHTMHEWMDVNVDRTLNLGLVHSNKNEPLFLSVSVCTWTPWGRIELANICTENCPGLVSPPTCCESNYYAYINMNLSTMHATTVFIDY